MISWSKSKLAIGVVVLALMIVASTTIITPRPASADPLAGAIGGATIGGLVTRRGGGVIAGAVIGGVVGGIVRQERRRRKFNRQRRYMGAYRRGYRRGYQRGRHRY